MIDLPSLRAQMDLATEANNRAVFFNYLILKHFVELEGQNPSEICKALGMKPSAATEFNKMMRLARFIRENPLHETPKMYKTTISPTAWTE
jgi:hypothetical protein